MANGYQSVKGAMPLFAREAKPAAETHSQRAKSDILMMVKPHQFDAAVQQYFAAVQQLLLRN